MLTPEFWRAAAKKGQILGTPFGQMQIHTLIMDQIREHAKTLGPDLKTYRLMDVGASPTLTLSELLIAEHRQRQTAEKLPALKITAIDPIPAAADVDGVEYKQGDAYALPIENKSQHAAVAAALLEYLHDQPRALRQIKNAIKKGGLLFLLLHAADSEATKEDVVMHHEHFKTIQRYLENKASREDALKSVKEVAESPELSPAEILGLFETIHRPYIEQSASDEGLQMTLKTLEQADKGRIQSIEQAKELLSKTGFTYLRHEHLGHQENKYWFIVAKRN